MQSLISTSHVTSSTTKVQRRNFVEEARFRHITKSAIILPNSTRKWKGGKGLGKTWRERTASPGDEQPVNCKVGRVENDATWRLAGLGLGQQAAGRKVFFKFGVLAPLKN